MREANIFPSVYKKGEGKTCHASIKDVEILKHSFTQKPVNIYLAPWKNAVKHTVSADVF